MLTYLPVFFDDAFFLPLLFVFFSLLFVFNPEYKLEYFANYISYIEILLKESRYLHKRNKDTDEEI